MASKLIQINNAWNPERIVRDKNYFGMDDQEAGW